MRNKGQTIYRANAGVSVFKTDGIHGGNFYAIMVSGRLVDGIHTDSSVDAAREAVYGARQYARALRSDME